MDASAELYEKNNASLRQAFANVLDFQSPEFHGAGLKLVQASSSNQHPAGEIYSATLGKVGKKKAGTSDRPIPLGKRSTLVAPISLRIPAPSLWLTTIARRRFSDFRQSLHAV